MTEVWAGSIVLPDMHNDTLARAILETLAYSDVFDYPLRLEEIHRYLPVRADLNAVRQALSGWQDVQAGYYHLPGRAAVVALRVEREAHSRALLPTAVRYGRWLGALPFVRMVALTGSLAVLNAPGHADLDYLLVTARDRVWTARAFALLLNRMTPHTLCPNLLLSESSLAWPVHDLYSARELMQMRPITGAVVYRRLLQANAWVQDFLPNAQNTSELPAPSRAGSLQHLFELPLRHKLGDRLERWEMNRKIARFSKQPGFGAETVFTAEVCQGNFDQHRSHTWDRFTHRVAQFEKG